MIPFDEIADRLKSLVKSREWLAEKTPYSKDYIRTVMAPNSTRRTDRVQQILSDAIEAEESRQQATLFPDPDSLAQHITVKCTAAERKMWDRASRKEHDSLDEWVVDTLNAAADIAQHRLGLVADDASKHSPAPPPVGKASYPMPTRKLRKVDKEKEA